MSTWQQRHIHEMSDNKNQIVYIYMQCLERNKIEGLNLYKLGFI